jgi:glycyl-tRNA synthetase beta chain
MAELLFEILSEEMPAGVQEIAGTSGGPAALIMRRLIDLTGLSPVESYEHAHTWATPRRLGFVLPNLPAVLPEIHTERKGPKVGAPDQAIQGFLRSAGLNSLDEAVQKDGAWFAVKVEPAKPLIDVLPKYLIDAMLFGISWPKSMRWRDTRLTWVRPIRNLLGIFDGKVLTGGLHLGHAVEGGRQPGFATVEEGGDDQNFLPFNGLTYGHRFLAPHKIEVASFADYQRKLEAAKVVLDAEARKAIIKKGIADKAASLGLTQIDDPRLLDEVAGLVEWPVPLIGKIDDQFLDLPPEVLTTSMRTHQKYFALAGSDGRVSHFAVVANIEAQDGGKAIVAGNERVLRARLSDARFFWDQDRKTPLSGDFIAKLSDRVFHAKIGTVLDKVKRVADLTKEIAAIAKADTELAVRAAKLAKADLSSGMVGEFPELQGVMGRYYALEQGERPEIADAIRDHYKPQGPSDVAPTAPVSVAVALADKIDTLREFFAIGEVPTGSKDPFALRRAAIGVIRLVLENKVEIDLLPFTKAGLGALEDSIASSALLANFLTERLTVFLRDQGLRLDAIRAAFYNLGRLNIVRMERKARAISALVGTQVGRDLIAAYNRIASISRVEEQKEGREFFEMPDSNLLSAESEVRLFALLPDIKQRISNADAAGDYDDAIVALSQLRAPVDAFFENVTVNDPDPELRINRLRLLNQLRDIFLKVADFSVIEG